MRKHITIWNLFGVIVIIFCFVWGFLWGKMGFILPYPLGIITAIEFKWE